MKRQKGISRVWIIHGSVIFLFMGLCGIFYILGGGKVVEEASEESNVKNMADEIPEVQVEELADSRMEAYNRAVLLLDQEEKERKLQEEHNSFDFFTDEVIEENISNGQETEVDEKNYAALSKFQEVSGAKIEEDRGKMVSGSSRKKSLSKGTSSRTAFMESEGVFSESMTEEELERAKEAEKKEKLDRLRDLYYGQSAEVSMDEETKEEVVVEGKGPKAVSTQFANGFKPMNGSSSFQKTDCINAVVHGEQRNVTTSSQVVLRLLDPIEVAGTVIPRNTTVIGQASFSGNRVHIHIENITYKDNVYPFKGLIYDKDGFQGIYFPYNLVNDAKTEAGSETITSTEVNLNGLTGIVNTGANALLNATKSVLNNSVKETKVTLPANYKLIIKFNE